jgi:hypothetical protein
LSPEIYSFLAATEVAFKVHHHSPIVSFSDAKAALPFDPGSMVKGLAFKIPNRAYAIVGMRAADRADYKKTQNRRVSNRADCLIHSWLHERIGLISLFNLRATCHRPHGSQVPIHRFKNPQPFRHG